MISDNTTQNIVFASREYQEIFGEDAKGILTNVWQIEYGGCFDVVWPWLYLQSRVNQGEQRDCRSMEFLKEYTTLEWGVAPEDDSLMQWYRLVDTEVSKAVLYEAFMDQSLRPVLEEMGNRPYKLFRWFFSSLFHTENILPLLHAERKKWLNGHLLEQIEGFYRQALSLAEGMSQHAVRRREEARHLLQYNHVLLTVLGLVKLEEQFEQCYHRAADCQFTNQSAFESYMKELASICGKIADGAQELADWVKVLYQEENYAADACVMPGRSVTELRKREVFLEEIAKAGNPLVSYQRYIRRPGDLPMVRHIGRDLSL